MIDVNKLRGKMAEKGYTGIDVARMINKSPKTFYSKLKKGKFDSDEITAMVEGMSIENPVEIFFACDVT